MSLTTENPEATKFIRSISHELKTPLQVMVTSTDLIEALVEDAYTGDRAEMGKAVRRMKNAIEMIRVQLSDLASYADTDSSRPIHSEPFLTSEILSKVKDLLQPVAASRNIGLSVVVPAEPVWVRGDPARMIQILTNLTDNAIKYSEKGQVVMRLSSVDNHALLEIADDGIGIHTDELSSMLLPFMRGSNAPRHVEGTGLGLSIVDKRTRQMGGTLSITQRPEGGTIARVSLPQHQP